MDATTAPPNEQEKKRKRNTKPLTLSLQIENIRFVPFGNGFACDTLVRSLMHARRVIGRLINFIRSIHLGSCVVIIFNVVYLRMTEDACYTRDWPLYSATWARILTNRCFRFYVAAMAFRSHDKASLFSQISQATANQILQRANCILIFMIKRYKIIFTIQEDLFLYWYGARQNIEIYANLAANKEIQWINQCVDINV